MKKLNRANFHVESRPIKVLQFGEGNFLRAFVDLAFHKLNEQNKANIGVSVVHSFPRTHSNFQTQDGLYTIIESSEQGTDFTIVDCLQEEFEITDMDKYKSTAQNLDINIVVSNTTEAGIVYSEDDKENPKTFPARLALWLSYRFEELSKQNRNDKVFVLPCELIENNGTQLKKYILKHTELWGFSKECKEWIQSCYFYDTLVDRIVPGFPKNFINDFQQKWQYEDNYAVLGEKFFLFAIQGDTEELDKVLPLSTLDLDVIYTDNLPFYRNRKVAVLNGAHTLAVSISILLDYQYVAESLEDKDISTFILNYLKKDVFNVLEGDDETKRYIESIISRFKNTYLEHQWESISLNTIAKFNTRNLPTLLNMKATPKYGLFALASIWYLYLQGVRQDTQYDVFKSTVAGLDSIEQIVDVLWTNKELYPITMPESWKEQVVHYYKEIEQNPRKALQNLLYEA